MKTTIRLTDNEARLCEEGKEFHLMRVLKPQPPDDTISVEVNSVGDLYYTHKVRGGLGATLFSTLQYPVGSRLGVRETFAIQYDFCDDYTDKLKPVYIYKSDMRKIDLDAHKWQSSATMPKEAIRKHVVVIENTVKRAQELKWEGIRKTYQPEQIKQEFINYFNSRYAKPRKCKDGYVCYPWDWESFHELYGDNDNLGYDTEYYPNIIKHNHEGVIQIYSWKEKPLKIYPNPYIEFPKVRAE